MKNYIKAIIILTITLFVSPVISHSTQWSRFITTQSRDDVTISFRQMRKNQAWSIEWYVKNDSDVKVEPVLISRHYICKNGESQELQQQSLGIYLPGVHRKGSIKDKGICPNSKIKFVEIESEIHMIKLKQDTVVSLP